MFMKNDLRKRSLLCAAIGVGAWITFVILEWPLSRPAGWLIGFAGIALVGAWFTLWRSAAGVGSAEYHTLVQLQQQIAREAVRLEKDRVALRQERALNFAQDEFPDRSDASADADQATDLVAAARDPEDWDARDAQVLALMREESERLFRHLLDNAYVENGEFNRTRLGDDLGRLIESIARVYQPDSEHPLLETSVEQLLRAVNRASVQMLVHFQQLPLDVKSYNLRETYQYVRAGAKYYGYYKKVEPYWTYARPLYHLGRLAFGTNPITIGVGWAVSELIKHGSVNYAHSYALRLFHDTVRIVGNEAAGIFGGDYRHRDPAWIYGMEVIALTKVFPMSQERLEAALGEVSGLALRSEYDRIFLYGCLSGKAIARPQRFPGRDFLSLAERQQVAKNLERHVRKQGLESDGEVLMNWKTAAEDRLGIHLRVGGATLELSEKEAVGNALRSLASFLIHFKGIDPSATRPLLLATQSARSAESACLDKIWDSIQSEPPMLYEIPAMGEATSVLTRFLDDLLVLEAEHAPRFPESAEAIEETAGYFRENAAKWRQKLTEHYAKFLLGELAAGASDRKRFPSIAAPLLLGLLNEGEKVGFFYEKVSLLPDVPLDTLSGRSLVLCGTDNRLLLLATSRDQSDLVWTGRKGEISINRVRGMISDDCQVSGGRWIIDADVMPKSIAIVGRKLNAYENRFGPLLKWDGLPS